MSIELQKDIGEPLLSRSNGAYDVKPEEMSKICHTDSTFVDPNDTEYPDRIISSKLFIEEFGGYDGIAQKLNTNLLTGHSGSDEEIASRKKHFGPNSFPPPKIKSIMDLVLENFDDPINVILLVAAIVSIAIGLFKDGFPRGLIDGVSIIIALMIIIIVNSVNNYISEMRLAALINSSNVQEVAVHRGSAEDTHTIDGRDIVVGDIVSFASGMKVPADMIMISGQDVECNESDFTGELEFKLKTRINDKSSKDGDACYMIGKSLIVKGSGKAVVVAVGDYSLSGEIERASGVGSEPTGLQDKLEVMAVKIGNFGILCAVLTFSSMLFRVALEMTNIIPCGCGNITNCVKIEPCQALTFEFTMKNRLWTEIMNTFIIAVTVIVVAIPEGLPLAVTIALSFSSAKMRKLNNLVRNLKSAEVMGGATHICSDKTGTLTQNQMTVMGLHAFGTTHQISKEQATTSFATLVKTQLTNENWQTVQDSILYNSSARIEKNEGKKQNKTIEDFPWITQGNVTEQGIIQFFMNQFNGDSDYDKSEAGRKIFQAKKGLNQIKEAEIEFTSNRKLASMVVKHGDGVRIYTKGAPEMLFEKLAGVLDADGKVLGLKDYAFVPTLVGKGEDTNLNILDRVVKYFADQAYRTILVAKKDMTWDAYNALKSAHNDFVAAEDKEILETDLEFIGIFGIQDPLRPTIIESIAQLKVAGITTLMCTGDNINTAIAISLQAGIVQEDELDNQFTCMTGKQFREYVGVKKMIQDPDHPEDRTMDKPSVGNLKKFKTVKDQMKVLARSSPEDKLLLVCGLQQCEGVVAVTGDGTNDAPALKKADVGFSMGMTGTDVAKNASDIVLLDDNFASTIVALKYGRAVYDNVRKFIQFQLAVNVVAMFIVFFGSVIIKDSPLNAVQMLWVNLVMDTLGALSLATEPPAHDILTRPPYAKNNNICTEVMWRNIFGHAIMQIVILNIIIFLGPMGWLTQPYGLLCNHHDQNGKCDVYNPFYANELYQTETTLAAWQSLNLQVSDFDQTQLALMRCQHYQLSYPKYECDFYNLAIMDQVTHYSPLDFKLGDQTQKLLHFTFVFQIFVFLQLFNQVNARKIEEGEINVFTYFFSNAAFIIVWVIEWITQISMVQVGGVITKCAPLNRYQNLICLAFGLLSLPWGVVIKFIPLRLFQCFSLDQEETYSEDQLHRTAVSAFKRSSTVKMRQQK